MLANLLKEAEEEKKEAEVDVQPVVMSQPVSILRNNDLLSKKRVVAPRRSSARKYTPRKSRLGEVGPV